MHWQETFIFQGKPLYYNRIIYNNIAERCVEVPIAFDFFANVKQKNKVVEIGNVLSNYENSLSDYVGLRPRRIIDKYEVALGVDNIDLMDIPDEEKYDVIICISTVEHVGQGSEQAKLLDLEAPLKAIAKIYQLLNIGGKAIITVPFGKLIDGGWFIQFSQEYLNLLSLKYQIPASGISTTCLKRIASEIEVDNPRQLWLEAEKSEFSNIDFGWPWVYCNGIAVIELTKVSSPFVLNLTVPQDSLVYNRPIAESITLDLLRDTYSILGRLREINLIIFPQWSESEDSIYQNLGKIIKSILNHHQKIHLALIIDTSQIADEDANLILSDIIMNLLAIEALDTKAEPEIILVGKLNQLQWQALLPRIQWRVCLEAENESVITEVAAQNIPFCTVDSLSSKRVSQLETGLWEFK